MKRERLRLSSEMSVEIGRDAHGPYYIGTRPTASMWFRDPAELRRWMRLKGGAAKQLDVWISAKVLDC